jgi:hypothetical protein
MFCVDKMNCRSKRAEVCITNLFLTRYYLCSDGYVRLTGHNSIQHNVEVRIGFHLHYFVRAAATYFS